MAKSVITIAWSEVPHLSEEEKKSYLASIPPHLRRARTEGVPYLGAGAIYSSFVTVESISIEPIPLPDHWARCFGQDVGWNRTAALWSAWDKDADIVYVYSEHYMAQEEPVIHANAIKGHDARGKSSWGVLRAPWIPGVIDPASRGRSQIDGKRLVEAYKSLGLDLEFADNSVEAGILEVWNRLSTGRLKVFNTLVNFFSEYRLYRRDAKGKVVKEKDHLMDCLRYLIMSGLQRAIPVRVKSDHISDRQYSYGFGSGGMSAGTGWMGS